MLFEKYKATNYREAELGAAEAEGNVGGGGGSTTTHSNKTIIQME